MIKRKGNHLLLPLGIFDQLEVRHHLPFELLRKNLVGYVCFNMVWILYKEEELLIRVPFARNRLWFRAIVSDPEFSAVSKLPQIYINRRGE